MLAAMQDYTKYRPSADNALMRWIVRHAAWLIPRFRGSEIQSPILPCHGRTVSWKIGGVWRNSSCTSSRGRKRIWKSSTKIGRQMEIRRVAGKERSHRRAPTLSERTMESCMREVYDDSQRTAGQKKTSKQLSRPHRSRGR